MITSFVEPTQNPVSNAPEMTLITMVGDVGIPNQGWINEYGAMTIPAFNSGITFLTETMAMFSLGIGQDTPAGKMKAVHPLNSLLSRKMNNFTTPFRTLQTWYHHKWVWGNGYLWVKRDKKNNPIALLNLNPEITIPFVYQGNVWYYINFEQPLTLPSSDVLHLAGIGFDGLRGYPLVQLMRQSLEVGKFAESHSAKFFEKGTFIKGAVEVPGILTDAQMATMRDSIRTYKGLNGSEALTTMILQAGAKLNNSTIPNDTSQLIETRRWSVIEVCQMLRVPPHILYELSHGKWNSVQQMGDEVIKYTFAAPMVQVEQELTNKLLTTSDQQQGFYVRMRADTLAKADVNTQQTTVLTLVNGGIITLNEGREQLELPSMGPMGDEIRQPVGGQYSTAPIGGTIKGENANDPTANDDTAAPDSENAPDKAPDAGNGYPSEDDADLTVEDTLPADAVVDPRAVPASYAQIIEPLLLDVAERVETKTDKAFEKRAGKPLAEVTPWANVFAEEQHRYVLSSLAPVVKVASALGRTIDPVGIANKYASCIKAYAATGTKDLLINLMKEVLNDNTK